MKKNILKKGVKIKIITIIAFVLVSSFLIDFINGYKSKASNSESFNYLEESDIEAIQIHKLNPIFTAIGAYMNDSNTEYRAYSNKFYTSTFSYLAAYTKNDFPDDEYIVENGKVVLNKEKMLHLSSAGFGSRTHGFKEMDEFTDALIPDESYDNFYVDAIEDMPYTAEIINIIKDENEYPECDGYAYNVIVDIKKNNEIVLQLDFRVVPSELYAETGDTPYQYSVLYANEER